MQTDSRNEPVDSPVPGVIPAPVRVEHDADAADQRLDGTPMTDEPDSARESRRTARDARREAPAERSGVMIPDRRKRLPLEAPLMRLVASAGIVAIGVVIAAIMTSQDSDGWLIGLVVSAVSLVLAALLWSSRRL